MGPGLIRICSSISSSHHHWQVYESTQTLPPRADDNASCSCSPCASAVVHEQCGCTNTASWARMHATCHVIDVTQCVRGVVLLARGQAGLPAELRKSATQQQASAWWTGKARPTHSIAQRALAGTPPCPPSRARHNTRVDGHAIRRMMSSAPALLEGAAKDALS